MTGFAIDVRRFGARTAAQVDLARRKIALDLFRRVIERSPVDTGRFRANWQTTVGERARGTRELFDNGSAALAGPSAAEALAVITGAPVSGDLWLANNLPYAVPLENGHSPQAPEGMVLLSMLEVPGIVRESVEAARAEVRQ